MKKTILAALVGCLLLLSACQRTPTESETPIPTPTQDQTAETPPVSPDPETSADPGATGDPLEFPQLLTDFDFPLANSLLLGGGETQYLTCYLSPEERAELKELLHMDSWWEVDEIPAMGLEPDYYLSDGAFRSFSINPWDKDKCLINAKDGNEGHLYYASNSVLETFEGYLSGKTFLPDFIRYFEMDQIEIGRSFYEDREGYKDFDVYLLDDTEQLAFFQNLDPDSWTVIREEELVAVMYFEALRAQDPAGNRINLAPWDEEKCLVNCFFADDLAVRYWAPASVLENALNFVDSHAPLGTIDTLAAQYYDLFWADPGLDVLILLCGTNGRITDDQIAAYSLTRLAYDGYYDYEVGVSPSDIDRLTQKHFGRILKSYETSMTKNLPSGNVTATGWDVMGSCHMVLDGPTEIDEYGNITGTFMLYQIDESTWIDRLMPPTYLDHAREHMLTGDDDQYHFPLRLSVTFRIETEEIYGVWREYIVYDAMRMMDWP